jgi:hypothetical protein
VKQLRNLSARPELVVAGDGSSVIDRTTATRVGIAGPFGRERVTDALPTNKAGGAVKLANAQALHDAQLCYLADPDGNLVGENNAVWVHRMLYARWTQDTRRLSA